MIFKFKSWFWRKGIDVMIWRCWIDDIYWVVIWWCCIWFNDVIVFICFGRVILSASTEWCYPLRRSDVYLLRQSDVRRLYCAVIIRFGGVMGVRRKAYPTDGTVPLQTPDREVKTITRAGQRVCVWDNVLKCGILLILGDLLFIMVIGMTLILNDFTWNIYIVLYSHC